ncbi:conserved hypothetical protein [Ricinus communis]|uniref:Uncharacterized protein n=1 Tax=Ricinus communis TaxID=3988 RepID=B9T2Q8_RICCO|nr:conserved hypothetical protein [Ricinus communis]
MTILPMISTLSSLLFLYDNRQYYATGVPGDLVVKAYTHQFCKDMDRFLHCRVEEIVLGGLILLTLPGRLNGTPHCQTFNLVWFKFVPNY